MLPSVTVVRERFLVLVMCVGALLSTEPTVTVVREQFLIFVMRVKILYSFRCDVSQSRTQTLGCLTRMPDEINQRLSKGPRNEVERLWHNPIFRRS